MSKGLLSIREIARKDKEVRFTTLLHHVDQTMLYTSFRQLKPKAAAGVDGVTWADYEEGLTDRIRDLHERVQGGAYRACPSRRVFIEKADGRLRPLGIAAIEDKIVQHAVGRILSAIYEEDFLGFSYGFRPNRDCHDALDALSVGIERKRIAPG
jgi:retron-type reverse transcriptase